MKTDKAKRFTQNQGGMPGCPLWRNTPSAKISALTTVFDWEAISPLNS